MCSGSDNQCNTSSCTLASAATGSPSLNIAAQPQDDSCNVCKRPQAASLAPGAGRVPSYSPRPWARVAHSSRNVRSAAASACFRGYNGGLAACRYLQPPMRQAQAMCYHAHLCPFARSSANARSAAASASPQRPSRKHTAAWLHAATCRCECVRRWLSACLNSVSKAAAAPTSSPARARATAPCAQQQHPAAAEGFLSLAAAYDARTYIVSLAYTLT